MATGIGWAERVQSDWELLAVAGTLTISDHWRLTISGAKLLLQQLQSGVWTTVGEFIGA